MIKKKSLLNYCGLLGVAAFLSYTAAVVFSPLAYPGYDWMAQAVKKLPFVWHFCSNCSWYDDGRRNGNEYCSERLFRYS